VRAVLPFSKLVRYAAPTGALFCVLSTWLSAGCGGDTKTTICEGQCTCAKNCSDATTDACVKAISASTTLAGSKGCNAMGEADRFFDCESERGACVAGSFYAGTCVGETQAFFDCLSRVNCSFKATSNVVDCE